MPYNEIMRVPLRDLMDKLGVGYILSAYETCPWSAYDEEKDLTCSAEVRMNNDADEVEAEMQFVRGNPQGDEKPIEQVFYLRGKSSTQDKWDVTDIRIKGENKKNATYNAEEKGCNFFSACVQELKMGNIPDIDAILEREMKDNERYGGGATGGSRKAPKIKPAQVMGMKGGGGM
ncbi:MAG: hypothetical protein AAF988_02620 [Pseudomonadota bacterium]